MREVVNARAMTVGEGMEKVKTAELGDPAAREGKVVGAAERGRSFGLRPVVIGTGDNTAKCGRAVGDVRNGASRRVGGGKEAGKEVRGRAGGVEE